MRLQQNGGAGKPGPKHWAGLRGTGSSLASHISCDSTLGPIGLSSKPQRQRRMRSQAEGPREATPGLEEAPGASLSCPTHGAPMVLRRTRLLEGFCCRVVVCPPSGRGQLGAHRYPSCLPFPAGPGGDFHGRALSRTEQVAATIAIRRSHVETTAAAASGMAERTQTPTLIVEM